METYVRLTPKGLVIIKIIWFMNKINIEHLFSGDTTFRLIQSDWKENQP